MKCGKPIAVESIWAGERICQCIEHATQLQVLGNAIGQPTSPQPIISDELCENEISEEESDE